MSDLAAELATYIGTASPLFPTSAGHAVAEVEGNRILVTVTDREGEKREFVATVTEFGGGDGC